jgi:hypothetical protein
VCGCGLWGTALAQCLGHARKVPSRTSTGTERRTQRWTRCQRHGRPGLQRAEPLAGVTRTPCDRDHDHRWNSHARWLTLVVVVGETVTHAHTHTGTWARPCPFCCTHMHRDAHTGKAFESHTGTLTRWSTLQRSSRSWCPTGSVPWDHCPHWHGVRWM